MRRVATVVSVAAFVVVVGACGWMGGGKTTGPATVPARGAPVASIRATDFWREYDDNPLKADLNYKDKWVELTGHGKSAQIDGRNVAGFTVSPQGAIPQHEFNRLSPDEKRHFREGYAPGVVCFIREGRETEFAPVLDDEKIFKIIGLCKGRRDSADAYKGHAIHLEFCELSK